MNENVNPHNCFDDRPVHSDPAVEAMSGTPREMFLARHAGHTVEDVSLLTSTSETPTLKCVDCGVAFAI